jgi:uncharacterized protein (DUF58 family)
VGIIPSFIHLGRAPRQPPPLPRAALEKSSLLDPAEIERFGNLLLFAQAKVEGYFSGKHRSPHYGSNVEFADYQEYSPGEDVAHMDWRVYGRTQKLFLRKFEEETDMSVYLLADTSASMEYRGAGAKSKFHQAARIAAALAYLMIRQGDKAALGLFSQRLDIYIPPAGARRHLFNIIHELERVRPRGATGLAGALLECASVIRKRGRLVILSDFLCEQEQLFDALGQFIHRGCEVLLLQVLDPDELDLPSMNIARFIDMETDEAVDVEPDEIRRVYRENMTRLTRDLAAEAASRRIEYALVNTRDPYLSAIEAYLGFRAHGRRGR